MSLKLYIYERFFVLNQNFTTEHVKIVQNSSFFFCLNCQIPGFSMFPGKVTTLFKNGQNFFTVFNLTRIYFQNVENKARLNYQEWKYKILIKINITKKYFI